MKIDRRRRGQTQGAVLVRRLRRVRQAPGRVRDGEGTRGARPRPGQVGRGGRCPCARRQGDHRCDPRSQPRHPARRRRQGAVERGLAARLDDLMVRGSSSITFVIGGSCGVSDEVSPAPTSASRSGASRCRTTSPASCCSSRPTVPSRSCAGSRTINKGRGGWSLSRKLGACRPTGCTFRLPD